MSRPIWAISRASLAIGLATLVSFSAMGLGNASAVEPTVGTGVRAQGCMSTSTENVNGLAYAGCNATVVVVYPPTGGFTEGFLNATFYGVTFNITELPSAEPDFQVTGHEPNGTSYSFAVQCAACVFPLGPVFAPGGLFGLEISWPGSVELLVDNPSYGQSHFPVAFTQAGLPDGTAWYVNLSNGDSYYSVGTTLIFFEPNGSYLYTLGSNAPDYAGPRGSFVVGGGLQVIPAAYVFQQFTVEFTETGLTSFVLRTRGWTVALGGVVKHGRSATIEFEEPNGTYPLLVTGPAGFRVSGSDPDVLRVAGTTNVTVSLEPGPTYLFTFVERGLGSRQAWCVALDAVIGCSTTNVVRFRNLTPANYTYAILSPTIGQHTQARLGVTPIPLSGNLTLSRNVSVGVSFAYWYTLVFNETGLFPGTNWSVTVRGVTERSDTPSITFYEPNGTYAYLVGPVPGFVVSGQSPKYAHVLGGPATAIVSFSLRP